MRILDSSNLSSTTRQVAAFSLRIRPVLDPVTLCPIRLGCVASVVFFLGGCASFTPGMGFDDVQRLVVERSAKELRWDHGDMVRQEVEGKLRELLAKSLSVDDAIQIAFLNNPQLQASYEELGIAQADMVEAGLLRNPLVSAEARFGSQGTIFEMSLVQSVLDLVYRSSRRRIGTARFEAAKLLVAGSVLGLAGEVRVAYLNLQRATQLCQIRQTALASNDASYELARRLYEAGNVTELDLSTEEVLYEQSKLDLRATELEVIQGREKLNILMGFSDDPSESWRIAGRLPELPETELSLEQLDEQALERSFAIAVLRFEIEAASARLGLAAPYSVLGDAELGAASEREGDWSTGPAVSFPLPLFGQGQTARGRAAAELQQKRERLKALSLAILGGARTARARLKSAREQASHYQKVVLPLRERIVKETQRRYNAMLVGAFQLLQAKQAEIEGESRYIEELAKYWRARGDVEQLLSGSFPTPLESTIGAPERVDESSDILRKGPR